MGMDEKQLKMEAKGIRLADNFIAPYYARFRCHTAEEEHRNYVQIQHGYELPPGYPSWDDMRESLHEAVLTAIRSGNVDDYANIVEQMTLIHSLNVFLTYETFNSHVIDSQMIFIKFFDYIKDADKFNFAFKLLTEQTKQNSRGLKTLEMFYVSAVFGRNLQAIDFLNRENLLFMFELLQVSEPTWVKKNSLSHSVKDIFNRILLQPQLAGALIDGEIQLDTADKLLNKCIEKRIDWKIFDSISSYQLGQVYPGFEPWQLHEMHMDGILKTQQIPHHIMEFFFPDSDSNNGYRLRAFALNTKYVLAQEYFTIERIIKLKRSPMVQNDKKLIAGIRENIRNQLLKADPELSVSFEGLPQEWVEKIFNEKIDQLLKENGI